MALTSYGVYLMKGTGTAPSLTWAKLVDIKDFPDIGGEPNMLDTTTLSDPAVTQTEGIRQAQDQKFTANYTKEDFNTLKALEGTEGDYAVYFGHATGGVPDGHDGKFVGKGRPTITVSGKGVDEVLEIVITFAMSVPFAPAA